MMDFTIPCQQRRQVLSDISSSQYYSRLKTHQLMILWKFSVTNSIIQCVGWKLHYPAIPDCTRIVKFVDVGMGFGGLTVALAELFPEKLVLGMEIRAKVSVTISNIISFDYLTSFIDQNLFCYAFYNLTSRFASMCVLE